METVIVGTGGMARKAQDILEGNYTLTGNGHFVGYLDEDESMHGKEIGGFKVLGGLEWLNGKENKVEVIVAVGNTRARKEIVDKIKKIGNFKFESAIDVSAKISSRVRVGEGCIICAGAIISTDVEIGNHCIINMGCTVGHDVRLNDYSVVAPGANVSGNTIIGEGSDIGVGSAIIQNKEIGKWSVIGAGAVVIDDIPDNVTVVGNPTRIL